MLDSTRALLEDCIKDLYNAERQLLKALPKMVKAASAPSLKRAFQAHLKETEVHLERLTQLGAMLGMKTSGKTCEAMVGLLAEGEEVMAEKGLAACLDAALIGAAQKVEHYEIASYGTARTLAERLDEKDAVALLDATLEEEKATDRKLSDLSTSEVLPAIPLNEGDKVEMVSSMPTQSPRRRVVGRSKKAARREQSAR